MAVYNTADLTTLNALCGTLTQLAELKSPVLNKEDHFGIDDNLFKAAVKRQQELAEARSAALVEQVFKQREALSPNLQKRIATVTTETLRAGTLLTSVKNEQELHRLAMVEAINGIAKLQRL